MHPMPACARLPLSFEVGPLRAAVAALPADAWLPHFNTGYYEGDWSGVALRAFAQAGSPLAPGHGALHDTVWCDAFWRAQLVRFETALRSVRLLRLGPGGIIREHRDHDLGLPDSDLRLHVPIVTDPLVDFLLDGERVPMHAGECWFLDLSRPHRVENHGGAARVHLVLDCRPSPWLDAQIASGLHDTPPREPPRGSLAFAAFRAHVHAHPELEQQLATHVDHATFVDTVLALAAQAGHAFGAQDVRAAMAQGRRDWQEQWRV